MKYFRVVMGFYEGDYSKSSVVYISFFIFSILLLSKCRLVQMMGLVNKLGHLAAVI